MIAPLELVIFDCDGVLIDSELLSVEADLACLAEEGIVDLSAEDILERYTGISMAGMLSDLETRYGRSFPDFAARHRQCLTALFENSLQPIRGIAEVLASLDGKVCVASSSTPDRLRLALTLVGLFDRLHPHIFSATQVGRGKPAPDLFLHAAARMGVSAQACVVVEDSQHGVQAARAAGMRVVGYAGGLTSARLLEGPGTSIIDDMRALPDLLDTL